MGLVSCNSCDRKHDRPVNSKCMYFMTAVAKCKDLGVSVDNFDRYLPELGSLDMADVKTTTPSRSPGKPFPLSVSDAQAILQDSQECKRQYSETQSQLAVLIQQMSDLTLAVSKMAQATPSVAGNLSGYCASGVSNAGGGQPGLPTCTTTPTTTTTMTTWSLPGTNYSQSLGTSAVTTTTSSAGSLAPGLPTWMYQFKGQGGSHDPVRLAASAIPSFGNAGSVSKTYLHTPAAMGNVDFRSPLPPPGLLQFSGVGASFNPVQPDLGSWRHL